MKIKNKKELILRAKANVRIDRLTNNTYITRGLRHRPEVCGIGCLALPHRKKEQDSFFARLGNTVGAFNCKSELSKQFGINESLANLLEALFVGARMEGGEEIAGKFIIGFAEHIPEGVNINSRSIVAFCKAIDLPFDYYPSHNKVEPTWATNGRYTEALFAWFDAGARVSKVPGGLKSKVTTA